MNSQDFEIWKSAMANDYGFQVPFDGSNKFYDTDAMKHFIAGADAAYNLLSKEISEKDEALGAIEKYARNAIGNEEKLMKVIRDIEIYASNALNQTKS